MKIKLRLPKRLQLRKHEIYDTPYYLDRILGLEKYEARSNHGYLNMMPLMVASVAPGFFRMVFFCFFFSNKKPRPKQKRFLMIFVLFCCKYHFE